MPVSQVPLHSMWPSGLCQDLAIMRYMPADLTQKYGLVFEAGVDDFDDFVVCALELKNKQQVWLFRYLNNPYPGTKIQIDYEFARKNDISTARGALDEVCTILEIDHSYLSWNAFEQYLNEDWKIEKFHLNKTKEKNNGNV